MSEAPSVDGHSIGCGAQGAGEILERDGQNNASQHNRQNVESVGVIHVFLAQSLPCFEFSRRMPSMVLVVSAGTQESGL